jgi:hypothetical protein
VYMIKSCSRDMLRKALPLLLAASIAADAFTQQPALKGIETADFDRSVQPCANFYDFSMAHGAHRIQSLPLWIAGAAAGKRPRSIRTGSAPS